MEEVRISDLKTAPQIEVTDDTLFVFNNSSNVTKNVSWGTLKKALLVLDTRIIINQSNASTLLGGVIDPLKEYFIDGVINMNGITITVPIGGISIKGYNFNVSKLVSTDNNYTMFVDAAGSGDVLIDGIGIEVSGTNSQVYNLTDVDGTHAFEILATNFNNCSSLGILVDYRQGLESDTGRFGGRPSLTFAGTWLGGYRITTSIIRSIDDTMPNAIFAQGVGFVMQSRFVSDINADVGTLAPFIDFVAANFPTPSTLQLHDCIITRKGVIDASDTTIYPNITAIELSCDWGENIGIPNTFVGGEAMRTVEIVTPIAVAGTFYDLLGTVVTSDLQHFDSPLNGQLRHLGNSPRAYNVFGEFILDCTSNNEIDLKLVIWRSAGGVFEDAKIMRRVVNNLQGGRDVAFFSFIDRVILNQNDYIKWQVANVGATNNITDELDSFFIIEKR